MSFTQNCVTYEKSNKKRHFTKPVVTAFDILNTYVFLSRGVILPSTDNMGDKTEKTTLIVRHLPEELSSAEQEDLLKHFGAVQVRCMGNRGHLKHTAFAVFDDCNEANRALKRLHQLDVLGCKLVVEFSCEKYIRHHPPPLEVPPLPELEIVVNPKDNTSNKKLTNIAIDSVKITDKINSFNAKLKFTYPMNPTFEYMYPAPSVSILTNIANALASVPKFYVQVLHLMNKMNLPAPFGAVTATPPLPLGEPIEEVKPFEPDILEEEEMDVSSTEESEIESDEEGGTKVAVPKLKRPARPSHKKAKRPKIQKVAAVTSKSQSLAPDPKDVFEQLPTGVVKKIGFKLPTAIAELFTENAALETNDTVPQVVAQVPTDILSLTESEATEETQGGFGKIEPVPKAEDEEEEDEPEEEWGAGEFISSRRLRRGRMKSSEMKHVGVFRNYSAGEPSSRLYIKNLPKQVTEKDMHYMYGKYVKWEDEVEQNTFDIRLMKEGRMKGQCFITLPSVKAAEDALSDTNAFVLHGRPMVVQFARSAKAKETDNKPERDRRK